MSASTERELETRNQDLTNALKHVGRTLADETVPPKRRIDQAMGVIKMYECEPKTTDREA